MRKNVFGRQFKRDANERKALFKNLLTSLVMNDRIKTSEAKAKAIKGAADKLVTKAKTGGDNAMRLVEGNVNHDAAVKLVKDLAVRFADRKGGYTRIVKMGRRVADNAPMAIIEWVDKAAEKVASPAKEKAKKVDVKKVSASATSVAKAKDVKKASADKEKKAAPKKAEKKEAKKK